MMLAKIKEFSAYLFFTSITLISIMAMILNIGLKRDKKIGYWAMRQLLDEAYRINQLAMCGMFTESIENNE